MAVYTTIKIDAKKIVSINEKLKQIEKDFEKLHTDYAIQIVKSMKRQLISQTKRASRTRSAQNIRAIRQSRTRTVIKMPLKLIYLDSMKPHYVSLKRGRMITKWAQKYYNKNYHKSGRSQVIVGTRGGIKGYLYVTPDPFIRTAILNVDNWLRNEITRIFNKINL